MEMTMEPCPFCGSEDVEAVHDLHMCAGEEYASVICNNCHVHLQGVGWGVTPEDAVFDAKCKWNHRYLPQGLMRRMPGADFDAPVYRCTECGCDVEWRPAWQHCPVCGCLVAGVAS